MENREVTTQRSEEELVVGPGAIPEQGIAPRPLLEGANESEYIEIFNPLSAPFRAKFGVTRPANAPVMIGSDPMAPGATHTESDLRTNYQLDLRNPNFKSLAHIANTTDIPAGGTVRVLGSEAQVIVRQLVNEIMQRENNKLMLADPYQRWLVESRIVLRRGFIDDLMKSPMQSVADQRRNALNDLPAPNQVAEKPLEEFPDARSASDPAAGQAAINAA